LKHDNVVAPGMPGLEALDITPTPIELIVPQYLARHRAEPVRAGRFPR
jgi:NADH dehydrogenase